MNHTRGENDKKAQCSNHGPEVAFEAVALAATAQEKPTAITYDITRYNPYS